MATLQVGLRCIRGKPRPLIASLLPFDGCLLQPITHALQALLRRSKRSSAESRTVASLRPQVRRAQAVLGSLGGYRGTRLGHGLAGNDASCPFHVRFQSSAFVTATPAHISAGWQDHWVCCRRLTLLHVRGHDGDAANAAGCVLRQPLVNALRGAQSWSEKQAWCVGCMKRSQGNAIRLRRWHRIRSPWWDDS